MKMSDTPCNPSFLAQKGNCNNESIMRMIAQNPSRLLAGLQELGGLNNTVSSSQLPYYQLLDHNQGGHDEREDEVNDDPISCHVEKKRRLTSEQVKSLEVSFDFESKLEPERKNQLAQELGLQPRQVAIWFQNRRARSKTKQLERDYEILKDKYDVVVAENGRLQEEITKLNQLLKKECISKEENDATSQVTVNGHEEVDAHTEKETDRQINLHADDAMSTQNPRHDRINSCSVNEREERGEDVWKTKNLKERQNCPPPPPLVEAQHAGRSALERLYNSLYMQHQAAVKVEDGYCTQEDLYGNALFTQEDHPPMMLNLDWS